MTEPDGEVTIAIAGKYTGLQDAYKSLNEALTHGGIANNVKVNLRWIEAEIFEEEDPAPHLENVNGILVPGGFGERGTEGKIAAAHFAPRAAGALFRHLLRHANGGDRGRAQPGGNREGGVHRVRTVGGAGHRLDDRMGQGRRQGAARLRRRQGRHHAARRLSSFASHNSRVRQIYDSGEISERHRHRYEVNVNYREQLENAGLIFSGMSPDGRLPEIVELPEHPWFIGVQFHPEVKSKPFDPHPLFKSFIEAAMVQSRLV